ncbi:MAG: hypothetical protein K0Q72_403, partial [Armatimonadetes bacterium]|nr:hypothetical protein [Armatimonadota bacterium]
MNRKLVLSQTAVTIAALLLSALAVGSSKAAPEPAAVAWGEVREGLQAGIRIPSGRLIYRQGEPLRAEIVLRNTTGKSIQVDNYAPIVWGAERLAERIVFRTRDSDAGYAGSETFILTAGEVMSAPLASPAVILREPGWTGDASDYTAPTLRLPAGTYQLSASRVLRQGFTDAEELKRGLPT